MFMLKDFRCDNISTLFTATVISQTALLFPQFLKTCL